MDAVRDAGHRVAHEVRDDVHLGRTRREGGTGDVTVTDDVRVVEVKSILCFSFLGFCYVSRVLAFGFLEALGSNVPELGACSWCKTS